MSGFDGYGPWGFVARLASIPPGDCDYCHVCPAVPCVLHADRAEEPEPDA